MSKYEAIIVGSGPNGLAAAITLQKQGLSTLLIEGAETIGGGLRTKELTLPGFMHDVCSAVHPMAMASPFFRSLPLEEFDLKFLNAKYPLTHPMDNGSTAILFGDFNKTVESLGIDGKRYGKLTEKIVHDWDNLSLDILAPIGFPLNPLNYAKFGINAIQPANWTANKFVTEKAKGLWAGLAAHSILPLSNYGTSAIAIVLAAVGNKFGWPISRGGSQSIANKLEKYYKMLGGTVKTNFWVRDIGDLPSHNLLFLDLTPNQILNIKGLDLSQQYRKKLQKFRYGMGIFKIDWALSEVTPFKDKRCQQSATVHLGNTFGEIAQSEFETYHGKKVKKPFVLFSQPSAFDDSRAPKGQHTGWAYCHVPNSSTYDYTTEIENQIERFAPGFKDTILSKHIMAPKQLQEYNPNYIGGDINGGMMDLQQIIARPTFKPYNTSLKKVYICSSSTPPGGGVHGMCGFHAATVALKEHFKLKSDLI